MRQDIGDRGGKLSGGQRQRISIARAVLKNPPILILDEATSNVDSETEARLQAALAMLLEGRTAIIVAHRLSTAEAADEVLVFDQGALVERGSHGELVAAGGVYTALYADWVKGTQKVE